MILERLTMKGGWKDPFITAAARHERPLMRFFNMLVPNCDDHERLTGVSDLAFLRALI
jgi:hypothetical protein